MFTPFKILMYSLIFYILPIIAHYEKIEIHANNQSTTIHVLFMSGEPVISVPKGMEISQIRDQVASKLNLEPHLIRIISGLQELKGWDRNLPVGINLLNVVINRDLDPFFQNLDVILNRALKSHWNINMKLCEVGGEIILQTELDFRDQPDITWAIPGSLIVGKRKVSAQFNFNGHKVYEFEPDSASQETVFHKQIKSLAEQLNMICPQGDYNTCFSVKAALYPRRTGRWILPQAIHLNFSRPSEIIQFNNGVRIRQEISPPYHEDMQPILNRFWQFLMFTYVKVG